VDEPGGAIIAGGGVVVVTGGGNVTVVVGGVVVGGGVVVVVVDVAGVVDVGSTVTFITDGTVLNIFGFIVVIPRKFGDVVGLYTGV
jgi:hypothetical protein